MEEYIPLKKGVRSRVEREISRVVDVENLEVSRTHLPFLITSQLEIISKFEASKTVSRARADSMYSLVKAVKFNDNNDKEQDSQEIKPRRKKLVRRESIIPAENLKTVELPQPGT